MSWDILILNSKEPVDFENGNWPDFKSKQRIIESIKSTFKESDWPDSSWGTLTNEFADIEFNLGEEESLGNNFMLHVRGGSKVISLIFQMCSEHGWIAYDMSAEKFIKNSADDSGFNNWKNYKEQVIGKDKTKKPWWKF
jgi:hypothetical protein